MEWCEGSTTAGPDDTLENRQYTESYVFDQKTKLRGTFGLNENGECPEGYVHIVITEAFDDQMDDFSRGYFSRIRGGVERFGVFPSESLSLTIEAQGAISKLNGGNLTSTTGESMGARIDVPADPDPEKPDTLTYTSALADRDDFQSTQKLYPGDEGGCSLQQRQSCASSGNRLALLGGDGDAHREFRLGNQGE